MSDLPASADADGWVPVMVTFDADAETRFVVNRLGPRAEGLEPARLRDCVRADAAAALERLRQQ